MKRLTIFALLAFAIPCSAQWKYTGFPSKVLAFGVHDTSFFISSGFVGDPLVFRWDPVGGGVSGTGWAVADNGMDPMQGLVTSFASLGEYFFAGMTRYTNGTPNGPGSGWESMDNGSHWTNNGGGFMYSNGTYIFGVGSDGIYLSGDSGKDNTWVKVTNFPATNIAGIGAYIFANSGSAIWRSSDNGTAGTWSQISPPFIGAMTTMGTLLFIPGSGMLAESTDNGSNWTTLSVDSAGVAVTVNCLVSDGKNLFAGTNKGVLVSTDTGKNWRAENDGLPNHDIVTMGIFDKDTLLFIDAKVDAGHSYSYYRPIPEITDTTQAGVREVSILPNDSLMIYPNPATGLVTILSGGTNILGVSVLNVLGSETGAGVRGAGSGKVNLDLSKLPSGTYFLQIETAKGTVMRKVVRE
jgi:hypothetical protein